MEGAQIGGGVEEAVQAAVEEVQAVQEGDLLGVVRLAALRLQLANQMLAVAAKGRWGKAELGGQGAVGHRGHEAAVNLRTGGMVADGTAFYHTCAPSQEFPRNAG